MSLRAGEYEDEQEMFNLVLAEYIKAYGVDYMYYFIEMGILLTMCSKPRFDYPKEVVLQEFKAPKQKVEIPSNINISILKGLI